MDHRVDPVNSPREFEAEIVLLHRMSTPQRTMQIEHGVAAGDICDIPFTLLIPVAGSWENGAGASSVSVVPLLTMPFPFNATMSPFPVPFTAAIAGEGALFLQFARRPGN